jgi:hypothetical protein
VNELTIEWKHIELVATLEGKSPLQIDGMREKFFKEREWEDEKIIEERPRKDKKSDEI